IKKVSPESSGAGAASLRAHEDPGAQRAATSTMDKELKSGSALGRYELLIRLGRGGMASVWVARERSPSGKQQRLVAVKAMLPELARHSDFRAMFLEEGQIVRSID